jgi:ATP-dependent DNA helicase DinG
MTTQSVSGVANPSLAVGAWIVGTSTIHVATRYGKPLKNLRHMKTRLVNRSLNPLLTTLPAKFSTIHDYQVEAVVKIVDAFDNGAKVVVLDAPTGSGKTLIAEIVRRELETRSVYVCHNKELQGQFQADFDYSSVLYGRSNYQPTSRQLVKGVSCEDCDWDKDRGSCSLCPVRNECPYQRALQKAIRSSVPVLNSAYWLTSVQNPRSPFKERGLTILDECDTVEGVLTGQVEIYVSDARQKQWKIPPPDKLTKEDSYVDWGNRVIANTLPILRKLEESDSLDIKAARELRACRSLVSNVQGMVYGIESGGERWVYCGGAGSSRRRGDAISFKPVTVSRFGKERVWEKDSRFLLMSGTVVSSGMLVKGLGWDEGYVDVKVESQFHARNRQVVVRPVADMTRKGQNESGRRGQEAIDRCLHELLGRHAEERVLIHSVSYRLAQSVLGICRDRPTFTYRMASDRSAAIADFRRTDGAVLVAPSADRGVDFPGAACRVQIILKVPFLSLGDKQTSERLYNTPDGKVWYNVQVARSLMQMVGRAVRSKDDWATTYVLDAHFVVWYKSWGHLLPQWFRKGIRFEKA